MRILGHRITHINPPGLFPPKGYTHVVATTGSRTLYISGQVAFDATGALVGKGDLAAQTEQVFANLGRAVAECGGTLRDIVKLTVFMTDATQVQVYRDVRDRHMSAPLPASSLVEVARLASPDLLIEVEAVAVLE